MTCGTCGSRRFVAVPDLCYKFGSWICMHCIKFVLTTLKQTSLAPKCIDNKGEMVLGSGLFVDLYSIGNTFPPMDS